MYQQANEFEECLIWFDKAIKKGQHRTYVRKGDTLVSMQRYEEALLCFKKYDSIEPNNLYVTYKIGNIKNITSNLQIGELSPNTAESLHYALKAAEIEPNLSFIHRNIATMYLQMNEPVYKIQKQYLILKGKMSCLCYKSS